MSPRRPPNAFHRTAACAAAFGFQRVAKRLQPADPTLGARGLRPVVAQIGRRFEQGLELFQAIPG